MKTKFPDDVDAKSPYCGSYARCRLVWKYFQQLGIFSTTIFGENRFLHIAPEECFRYQIKRNFSGSYMTADLLAPDVDIQMDITDIQYPDESFNLI